MVLVVVVRLGLSVTGESVADPYDTTAELLETIDMEARGNGCLWGLGGG